MNLELPYVAGFFDGEGCIALTRHRSGQFQFNISLSQKHREVLDRVQETFGGSVYAMRLGEYYQWRIGGWKAHGVLVQLMPWLIVKRSQAEVILEVYGESRRFTQDDYELLRRLKDIRTGASRDAEALQKAQEA